ncbi:hypothetical protein ACSS6W_000303 [Trichoderma asperelloides]
MLECAEKKPLVLEAERRKHSVSPRPVAVSAEVPKFGQQVQSLAEILPQIL